VIKWALAISAPAFSTTRSAHIGLALGLTLAPALAANLATAAAAIATTLGNTGRLPISGCGLVRDTSTTLRTRLLPRRLRALGRLFTLRPLGRLFALRTNALAVAFLTPWLRLTRLSLFTRAAGS